MLIAGTLTGIISTLLATGVLARAALIVTGSVLSGLVATAIVQSWLDVVGGDWAANAGVLSLTVLAIASIVAGLKSLFGQAGAALGALTMVLIGNPFSAVAAAPELLPRPAGGIGQLFPPGAGSNLLRSTGYFDGAAAGGHITVLAAWTCAGLALLGVAAWRLRTAPARSLAEALSTSSPRPFRGRGDVTSSRSSARKLALERSGRTSRAPPSGSPGRRATSSPWVVVGRGSYRQAPGPSAL